MEIKNICPYCGSKMKEYENGNRIGIVCINPECRYSISATYKG